MRVGWRQACTRVSGKHRRVGGGNRTEVNNGEFLWTYMRADPEGLHVIQRLSGAGKLQILVEKNFPINEVREGHEAKEKGRDAPGPTYSLHASQFMDHHMKELLH